VGSEELLEQIGDRAGGLDGGPVPDAGQDLDGGVAVRLGESWLTSGGPTCRRRR
jgi:hypothetical protein